MFDPLGDDILLNKFYMKIVFHHQMMSPEDIEENEFSKTFGVFEYLVVSKTLRNSRDRFKI